MKLEKTFLSIVTLLYQLSRCENMPASFYKGLLLDLNLGLEEFCKNVEISEKVFLQSAIPEEGRPALGQSNHRELESSRAVC